MAKTSTKRAMLGSAISLLLCFAMLLGTTFAWFTDNVTSTNNIIKSGNLDVEMYWADGKTDPATTTWADASKGAIFNNDLWEPGYTEVRHIKIANEGTLALKYQLQIEANGEVSELAEVIDVYYADPAVQVADRTVLSSATKLGTLKEVLGKLDQTASGNLLSKENHTITLALKMQESAGNEYQNKAIGTNFTVKLLATQLESEEDSFGKDYDKEATYPAVSAGNVPSGSTTGTPITAEEVKVTVPAGAEAGKYELAVTDKNVTTNGGETTVSYDISLYKDGEKVSGVAIPVEIYVGKPFNVTGVTHNGNAINDYDYNLATGVVSFVTDSFSPFAITYKEMEADYFAETADELIEALEKSSEGDVISLTNNIKIDPANMSNAYGTTGINVKKGQILDGNGFKIDIKGAGGTWDSGISITGGTIKNITVTGSFRGIFINHNSTYSAPVILENVVTTGTVYTISCDQGTNNGLTATNCTFNGWTSFAATLGNATFKKCKFAEGSGYAYCRPYASTEFIECEFETGFEMDPRAAVTLEKCTLGGAAITADNLATLVTSNIANASVK